MQYNFLREATECLLDEERTRAFRKAISQVVRPGDTVLDCGTGTGILAIFAAKEGARSVIAVENNRQVYELACENVRSSGLDNIRVVHGDASCQEPTDVVIMELLDTLLITGDQVRVYNGLYNRGSITANTKVIPLRVSNFFEPVFYDFEFHECNLPMIIQARNLRTLDRCMDVLGSAIMYSEVKFTGRINQKVSYEGRHMIHTKGWLDALKFSTVTHLTDDIILGATPDMNTPVFVPVHEMMVKPGDVVDVKVEYTMSSSYDTLNINLR